MANNSEQWDDCIPGALVALGDEMRAMRRRQNLITLFGATACLLILCDWTSSSLRIASSAGPLTCAEAQVHLPAYVQRELEQDLRDRVEEHLEKCPTCRRQYERLEDKMRPEVRQESAILALSGATVAILP